MAAVELAICSSILARHTLCCTPSYALFIAETLHEMGYTKDDLRLQAGCFGAGPWSAAMRSEIENRLGLRAHDL